MSEPSEERVEESKQLQQPTAAAKLELQPKFNEQLQFAQAMPMLQPVMYQLPFVSSSSHANQPILLQPVLVNPYHSLEEQAIVNQQYPFAQPIMSQVPWNQAIFNPLLQPIVSEQFLQRSKPLVKPLTKPLVNENEAIINKDLFRTQPIMNEQQMKLLQQQHQQRFSGLEDEAGMDDYDLSGITNEDEASEGDINEESEGRVARGGAAARGGCVTRWVSGRRTRVCGGGAVRGGCVGTSCAIGGGRVGV